MTILASSALAAILVATLAHILYGLGIIVLAIREARTTGAAVDKAAAEVLDPPPRPGRDDPGSIEVRP